jgi:hypothetical protein
MGDRVGLKGKAVDRYVPRRGGWAGDEQPEIVRVEQTILTEGADTVEAVIAEMVRRTGD